MEQTQLKYGERYMMNIGFIKNPAVYIGKTNTNKGVKHVVIQKGNGIIYAFSFYSFKIENETLILMGSSSKELKGLEKNVADKILGAKLK